MDNTARRLYTLAGNRIATCLAVTLWCLPAKADEGLLAMSLEQLLDVPVTGVSRYAQKAAQAPSAVTVITRQQIRDHAWRTLADLLDSVPGLFVTTDRMYRYLGVRGFQQPSDYNTNVLLLVDGVPANDAVYQQAFLGGEGLFDLAVVDRVEFIPGPGSSVYGSNAILGVINVITLDGRKLDGTHLETSAGENDLQGVAVRHGWADDRRDLLLSASAWRDDGETLTLPPADGMPFGRISGLEQERGHRLMARYAWDDFVLLAAHSDRRKGYASAPYGTVSGASGTRARDEQWLMSLAHRRNWSPGLDLQMHANLGGARYEGNWNLPDGPGRDDSSSRWWGLEIQATDTRIAGHTLSYGLEYRDQYRLRQRYTERLPDREATLFHDRRSARHVGVYIQDEWRLDDWLLNAGLRVDHYSSFGTTLNPRLGLIHELTERTTLKYLAGTAYRAPSVFEMYYNDDDQSMKSNPEIDPERVRSLEIVIDHRTEGDWRLQGSLFHNRISKLIVQDLDGDGLLVYRNHGKAEIHGLSAAVRRSWESGTRLSLSSSWQRVRDPDTDERLSYSPANITKADLTLPFGVWRLTLEGRHLGSRRTTGGRVDAQHWFNLALVSERPALAGARVALRIDNLGDQALEDPASEEFSHDRLPREGRRAALTLAWRF